ncbi:MAG: hypothetical protein V2I33_23945, partial [Kangiellaceae bacterium]|jgi:hypothetical protein|nr:hypothetical protein [Kangiellaceae bacterium]
VAKLYCKMATNYFLLCLLVGSLSLRVDNLSKTEDLDLTASKKCSKYQCPTNLEKVPAPYCSLYKSDLDTYYL